MNDEWLKISLGYPCPYFRAVNLKGEPGENMFLPNIATPEQEMQMTVELYLNTST